MITTFEIFERQDLDKIDKVNNLFNKIYNFISEEEDFNRISEYTGYNIALRDNDVLYILYDNDPYVFIAFWNSGSSFGNVNLKNGMDLPVIYVEIDETDKIDKNFILNTMKKKRMEIEHEITHLFDKKYGDKNSGDYLSKSKSSPFGGIYYYKKYYNNTKEINAYYMMSASYMSDKIKEFPQYLDNFNIFKDHFINHDESMKQFYFYLTDENKKKFISRCYNLYQDLKNKN
jgi:hypothetical protein